MLFVCVIWTLGIVSFMNKCVDGAITRVRSVMTPNWRRQSLQRESLKMEQPTKSLFEIFSEFPAVAPKNLGELRALAKEYRKFGKHETADWIDDWVDNHIKHYKEEWEVDDASYA